MPVFHTHPFATQHKLKGAFTLYLIRAWGPLSFHVKSMYKRNLTSCGVIWAWCVYHLGIQLWARGVSSDSVKEIKYGCSMQGFFSFWPSIHFLNLLGCRRLSRLLLGKGGVDPGQVASDRAHCDSIRGPAEPWVAVTREGLRQLSVASKQRKRVRPCRTLGSMLCWPVGSWLWVPSLWPWLLQFHVSYFYVENNKKDHWRLRRGRVVKKIEQ